MLNQYFLIKQSKLFDWWSWTLLLRYNISIITYPDGNKYLIITHYKIYWPIDLRWGTVICGISFVWESAVCVEDCFLYLLHHLISFVYNDAAMEAHRRVPTHPLGIQSNVKQHNVQILVDYKLILPSKNHYIS